MACSRKNAYDFFFHPSLGVSAVFLPPKVSDSVELGRPNPGNQW